MKRLHRRPAGRAGRELWRLRLKRRETEEDSVSCPMKYSTDVEFRSDSLAVISYRDTNQFTYVNLSYDTSQTQIGWRHV